MVPPVYQHQISSEGLDLVRSSLSGALMSRFYVHSDNSAVIISLEVAHARPLSVL